MGKPMNFMFDGQNPDDGSSPENMPEYDSIDNCGQDQDFECEDRQNDQFVDLDHWEKRCNDNPQQPVNITIHDNTYDERRETVLKYTLRFILVTMFIGTFYYFGVKRINKNYEQTIAMEEGIPETTVVEPEPVDEPRKGLITAISYSETNPVVVIDDEVLKVGESIHNVTVVSIMPDKVEFQKNGKTWTQNVRQEPPSDW